MGKRRIAGVRTAWTTVDDGEFYCPACGGDRNYERRTGRRRVVVLGVPVLPRGAVGPVLECAACHGHFGLDALGHPTTTRLAALLRDAVHTVALCVLAISGSPSRTAREAAVDTIHAAGFPESTEEQLLALLATVGTDGTDLEGALDHELHEALTPLAPHLAPAGRESLLLQSARIALADGPYQPAERAVLATLGSALQLSEADTERLLAAARTPF